MINFRFVVLTAVSDPKQAEREKDSLDDQLRKAKAFGEREGGTFVREYRADGYSRSGYWDLSDAFRTIPAFGELQRDTYRGTYDVVIVDSYDRFGSTVFAFWEFLKPHKKQFRSAQQALPIEDPAIYNPSRDDSTTNMIVSSMMIQGYRINKITRAFDVGSRKRARDGKYGTHVPYGYIKIDKSTVIVDENVAPLIRNFAHWYLEGKTMGEIIRLANASGTPPRDVSEWSHKIILYILKNPFYAGKTFHGIGYIDKNGIWQRHKQMPELFDGRHEALWSWDTYLRLQEEIARRSRTRHVKQDYNLTGLLKCSVCGEALHISYSTATPDKKYWYCDSKHVRIRKEDAETTVADEIIRLFKDKEYQPAPQETVEDYTAKNIKNTEKQISRLDAAFQLGSHTPESYAAERRKLLARLDELRDEERQKEELDHSKQQRAAMFQTMQEILPYVHLWIANHDPRVVKYHLSKVLAFTAFPDKTIKGTLL